MNRSEYLSGVREFFYEGEMLGEAVFERYLELETDPVRQLKWAALLQLETETKARLRPFLMGLGLSIARKDESERVTEFANAFASKSWQQHMEEIIAVTGYYLQGFRSLEAAAPESERAIAQSMVAHEASIYRFAELELAGEAKKSLDDVIAQLRWPPMTQ